MPKKQKEPENPFKSWHACNACNLKLGGIAPEGERCITVMMGTCPYCGEAGRTLVPHDDYHWPKLGRSAIWD